MNFEEPFFGRGMVMNIAAQLCRFVKRQCGTDRGPRFRRRLLGRRGGRACRACAPHLCGSPRLWAVFKSSTWRRSLELRAPHLGGEWANEGVAELRQELLREPTADQRAPASPAARQRARRRREPRGAASSGPAASRSSLGTLSAACESCGQSA